MAKGVYSCPVCGTQYAGNTPGGPCSSRCAATQRQRSAMGQKDAGAAPERYSGGRPDRRTGSGPNPKGRGCKLVLLPPAVLGAAIATALLRLRRH